MSRSTGNIAIDSKRCKGCGLCIPACPKNHIRMAEQADPRGIRTARVDEDNDCNGCKFCYMVCPDVAITVFRKKAKG